MAPRTFDPELGANDEVGNYRIVDLLGAGATGKVFRALHLPLKRTVALKILSTAGDDLEDRERFLLEGRMMASISEPHVVKVFDVGLIRGRPFLALELINGPTLAGRQRESAPLSTVEALGIVRDCARGLAAVHAAGLLHRDVKPTNIFLEPVLGAVIGDLGFAKDLNRPSGLTASGIFVGTPAYASPEAARGEPLTLASDLFALGLVLLECLGVPLSVKGDPAQLFFRRATLPVEVPVGLGADVAPGLSGLVARMLAFDPGSRVQSAGCLADELDELLSAARPPALEPSVSKPAVITDPIGPSAGASRAMATEDRAASSRHRDWRLAIFVAVGLTLIIVVARQNRGHRPGAPEGPSTGVPVAAVAASLDTDAGGGGERLVQQAMVALVHEAHAAHQRVNASKARIDASALRVALAARFAEGLELLARVMARGSAAPARGSRRPAPRGGRLLVQAYRAAAAAEHEFRELLLAQEDLGDPAQAVSALVAIEAEPMQLRQSMALAAGKLVVRVEHLVESEPDPILLAGMAIHLAYATFAQSDAHVRQFSVARAERLARRCWPGLPHAAGFGTDAADAVGALLEVLHQVGAHDTLEALMAQPPAESTRSPQDDASVAWELVQFELEAARIEVRFAPAHVSTSPAGRRQGLASWKALARRLERTEHAHCRGVLPRPDPQSALCAGLKLRQEKIRGEIARISSQLRD